jgi:hypothetical protein
MNQIVEGMGKIIVGILILCGVAVLSGTLLWLIWEDSITAMFPKAVETGVLASTLTWWQSVKITWIFTLLLKATNTNSTSSSDKKK